LKAISMRGRWLEPLGLATMAALFTASGAARAQTDTGAEASSSAPARTGAAALGADAYWALGASRFFVSSTVDAGYLYFRPQLAIGYGRPHIAWVGAEIYPSVSNGNVAEYAGLRAAFRYVDFRLGARYLFTFSRRFLAPRASYSRDDIDTRTGNSTRYVALNAEVAFSVPLPVGGLFGIVGATGNFGVPEGLYVFDETYRTVMKPPFIARGRLGYAGTFGDITLGGFGEVIENPARDQTVLRIGPTAGLQISDHLDLFATFAFVIVSRDRTGLAGGDLGTLGVRYRWASGEAVPVYMIP
jgi:hypothetical protein